MRHIWNSWASLTDRLETLAPWLGWLTLRLLTGWEFLDAGLEKYAGENWFSHIQEQFLFPFNHLPAELNWQLAMWFEIIGGAALMLGAFTRFFAVSLCVITVVAIAAVHWPDSWSSLSNLWESYTISKRAEGYGNFKLPLMFITMLLPLVFSGGGKLSLDHLLRHWAGKALNR